MNDTASLLEGYRSRLRAASAGLPPEVRDELLDDVEAHLAEIRATSPSREATVAALERLGTPEQVASAAAVELGPPPVGEPAWSPPPPPVKRVRGLDVTAVVLLLVGAFVVPGIGWVIGVVLLWMSATWTTGEKLLGTFVVPGGMATPLVLLLFGGQTCYSETVTDAAGVVSTTPEVCDGFAFPPWIGIPLVIVLVVAPPVVAATLLRRSSARTRAGVDADGTPRP